jgi:hypothetical protein
MPQDHRDPEGTSSVYGGGDGQKTSQRLYKKTLKNQRKLPIYINLTKERVILLYEHTFLLIIVQMQLKTHDKEYDIPPV